MQGALPQIEIKSGLKYQEGDFILARYVYFPEVPLNVRRLCKYAGESELQSGVFFFFFFVVCVYGRGGFVNEVLECRSVAKVSSSSPSHKCS